MGGGPWNNTRGHSLCLQVEVVVTGGPWNNTRGRSLCLQVGVVVGGNHVPRYVEYNQDRGLFILTSIAEAIFPGFKKWSGF